MTHTAFCLTRLVRLLVAGLSVSIYLVSGLSAQIDSLQIDGPREVSPGQLVRLEARLEPNESPFWIVLEPIDLDYEQVNDGTRLIFSVGCDQADTITVLLLAQQIADGRIETRQIRRTIQVVDEDGNPVSEVPQPADSEKELQKSPLYLAVHAAWDRIETESARSKTDLIAKNFETVASLCRNGNITQREKIWKTLSDANHAVLATEVTQWDPVGIAVQQGLQGLGLTEIADHAFHLNAIATALRSKIK